VFFRLTYSPAIARLLLAVALALGACDRKATQSASPAPAEHEDEREPELVWVEAQPEEREPADRELAPHQDQQDPPAGDGGAAAEPPKTSVTDDDLSGTLILEGPMRVELPAGFPVPAMHREKGELHGFEFSTTTYESYSDLFGLIATSWSEFEPATFGTLSASDLLDGVKQTLLIELGGDLVREQRNEHAGRQSLDLILRTQLGDRDVHIRVVAHLRKPHLAQAMLISPMAGGVEDPLAERFFASLMIRPQID
jgi:hypothetical protein